MEPILGAGLGEWLSGTGPESDIVISTRIRLARNITGYPFLTRIDGTQRETLAEYLQGKLEKTDFDNEMRYIKLDQAEDLDRKCLVERHLISRDLEKSAGERGVAIGQQDTLSIMVNEEDHLRIQVLRSGLQLRQTWDQIRAVDDQLERSIEFAFSPDFGYLTACPTNVGTGMRISVMLHLPALVLSKSIDKVIKIISKIDLTVRGFYGEGTLASGDFFQISNQITLGKSEREILDQIADHVPQVIKTERKLREQLLETDRLAIEDRVWRSFGILERARTLTSDETMEYLSGVRMGVCLGLIDCVTLPEINELFIKIQPAHLQKREGEALSVRERDALRATLIREHLKAAQA